MLKKLYRIIGEPVSGTPTYNWQRNNVEGADLGYPALYKSNWYFAFGDTRLGSSAGDFPTYPNQGVADNFTVGVSPNPTSLDKGLPFSTFLNLIPSYSKPSTKIPFRAVTGHDSFYTLPCGLCAVHKSGKQVLMGAYMLGGNLGGSNHWAQQTNIVIYNDIDKRFHDYKPGLYEWGHNAYAASKPIQYDFGNVVFYCDDAENWLYMLGTHCDRYDGVKLARINVPSFLDPNDKTPWSYWDGSNWVLDINKSKYVINPPTSGFGVTEFSIIHDPKRERFLLLTASDGVTPYMLHMYSAKSLKGPWTKTDVPVSGNNYAPYAMQVVNDDLYFLMSDWPTYGVNCYKLSLV